jgi:hypothetical protein
MVKYDLGKVYLVQIYRLDLNFKPFLILNQRKAFRFYLKLRDCMGKGASIFYTPPRVGCRKSRLGFEIFLEPRGISLGAA